MSDLPEFSWTDLYAKVAEGLNDPDWDGYSKKNRNAFKRIKIQEAAEELAKYDKKRDERLEAARQAVE